MSSEEEKYDESEEEWSKEIRRLYEESHSVSINETNKQLLAIATHLKGIREGLDELCDIFNDVALGISGNIISNANGKRLVDLELYKKLTPSYLKRHHHRESE